MSEMSEFSNIIRINGKDYAIEVLPSGACICKAVEDHNKAIGFKEIVAALISQPIFSSCSWGSPSIKVSECDNWDTKNSLGIDWKVAFDVSPSIPSPRKISKKEQEALEKALIRMELCEAGFAKNKRPKSRSRLVNLFYLQQKCFERSIESLGRYHHLGIYREERKTV